MAYVFDPINNTLIDDEDKSLGNKLALNDDEFQKLLDIPGVFRASEAPQPPPKQEIIDREAINRFIRDNRAEGGRLKAAFPLLAPALLPYAAAFLGTTATGLVLQKQVQNYFENNPDAIDKFNDYNFADQITMICPLENNEKQLLLETASISKRNKLLQTILDSYISEENISDINKH